MFVRLGWKRLPGTNTSLLLKFVNYGQKEPLPQTFIGLTRLPLIRKLGPLTIAVFQCSESVKFVKGGNAFTPSFIGMPPEANVIKLFTAVSYDFS